MTQGLVEESGCFRSGDVGVFIEFTLSALYEIIAEQAKRQDKRQDKRQVDLTDTQITVLNVLRNKALSRKGIFATISMNGDSRASTRHIELLLNMGLIEMAVPDKPNSRLQKYRLTELGKGKFA